MTRPLSDSLTEYLTFDTETTTTTNYPTTISKFDDYEIVTEIRGERMAATLKKKASKYFAAAEVAPPPIVKAKPKVLSVELGEPIPAGFITPPNPIFLAAARVGAEAEGWYCGACNYRYIILETIPESGDVKLKATCFCVVHKSTKSGKCGSYVSLKGLKNWRVKCEQGHCPKCCTCWTCQSCWKVTPRLTDAEMQKRMGTPCCGSCVECCKCTPCGMCTKKVSSSRRCQCTEGRTTPHHAQCCDADERLALATSWNAALWFHRLPHFHTGVNFLTNRCRRHLSIESEVDSGVRAELMPDFHRMLKKWKHGIVADMSFKCPPGFEVNTAPASGDAFERMVEELAGFYEKSGAKASPSCGMHVHVDARDFFYPDLVNLIHLYARVELALFAMLPPWRRFSHYSAPCGAKLMEMVSRLPKEGFIETMKSPEFNNKEKKKKSAVAVSLARRLYGKESTWGMKKSGDPKRGVAQDIRYSALNIHSWIRMKTIEFRLHHGSTDKEEMLLWPQLLGTIIEYAKRTPLRDIRKLPVNPKEALAEVLKPKSWSSPRLLPYMEKKIKENCPDYDETWEWLLKNNCVLPMGTSHPEYGMLGWHPSAKVFTWVGRGHSEAEKFRTDYARNVAQEDLHPAVRGKVAWIAAPPPPPPPRPAAAATAETGDEGLGWTPEELRIYPALQDPRIRFTQRVGAEMFNALGGCKELSFERPYGGRYYGYYARESLSVAARDWFGMENAARHKKRLAMLAAEESDY